MIKAPQSYPRHSDPLLRSQLEKSFFMFSEKYTSEISHLLQDVSTFHAEGWLREHTSAAVNQVRTLDARASTIDTPYAVDAR
jgi:hypothetical protein